MLNWHRTDQPHTETEQSVTSKRSVLYLSNIIVWFSPACLLSTDAAET